MKRLLLDVDGVIADFTGAYLKAVEAVCGAIYGHHQVRGWDIVEQLDLPEWVATDVHERMSREGVAQGFEAFPGAIDAVKILSKRCEIYFVTSPFPSPTWTYDREAWLVRHFGRELGKRVVHTSHKELVHGDALVDDKPSNVCDWSMAHPHGQAMLWDAHHNQAADAPVPRIYGWTEVVMWSLQ